MADKSHVPLLSVEGLKKYYTSKSGMFSHPSGVVRAVDGVSFQLFEGKPWGWWENPAAANPRWGASW